MRTRPRFFALGVAIVLTTATVHAQPDAGAPDPSPPAHAPDPDPNVPAPGPATSVAPASATPSSPAVHPDDPVRKEDLTPRPAEPPPRRAMKFTADPIADTGVIVLGLTFGALSSALLSTGEIRPQQISPTFQTSQLLGIDRGAVTQTVDTNAKPLSDYGLYAAVAFAVGDSIADIWREGRRERSST